MNRFSKQSTKPQRLLTWHMLVVCWVLVSLSCVTQPEPAGEPTAAATAAATAEAAAVAVAPDAIALFRSVPAAGSLKTPLAEPDVRSPLPATPANPAKAAIDITVLSSSPVITFAPVRLPEPAAPAPVAPARTPAPVAAKPVAAAPAAVAVPAAPVAKAGAASSGGTATVPATQTKPAAAAAQAAAQAPTGAKPEPSQSPVLPATPASSARVESASRPVAETKLATTRGERFELRFPGSGWIYLGDELGREGLRYETRRFEDNAAIFAMNPEQAGEYLLRFQRQNPVDRSTEVSLVRVTVADKPAPAAAVLPGPVADGTAPDSYATPGPASTSPALPALAPTGQPALAPAAQPATQAAAQPTASPGIDVSSMTDPAELIKRARDELDAKRTQSALDALDRYLALYPYGSDEVYFLYGLAYEQDTPFRNIKKSYDAYRRVRDEYPRSARWKDAADRIAYLEKHYLGLR